MATLELQQVKCPSCGANITSFNPFQAEVECPYCHNKAFNPLITAKEIPIPDDMVLFTTNQEEFEVAFINALIETDLIPIDIFDKINPDNAMKMYIPMYLFEGSATARWNCDIGYDETRQVWDDISKEYKNKTYTRWEPANGTKSFNFSIFSSAYQGNEIPAELNSFISVFYNDNYHVQEFDPTLLNLDKEKNILTLNINTEYRHVWKGIVANFINRRAIERIEDDFAFRKIRNLDVSSSAQSNHESSVLFPIWFIYYEYEGKRYYYIMDGPAERQKINAPVDEKTKKIIDDKKQSMGWGIGITWVIWLIAIIIGFSTVDDFTDFMLPMFGLMVVAGIISAIIYSNYTSERDKILNGMKEQRRAAAKRFLSR